MYAKNKHESKNKQIDECKEQSLMNAQKKYEC